MSSQVVVEMIRQIGMGNVMAISGGRWLAINENTVDLPAGAGYRVRVEYYPGSDDYRVTRYFMRSGELYEHGSIGSVYADQVGELAYRASCYQSYNSREWMVA